MTSIEELKSELESKSDELQKRGFNGKKLESALLYFILEKRKKERFSIPELEELVRRRNEISHRLKNNIQIIQSISGSK